MIVRGVIPMLLILAAALGSAAADEPTVYYVATNGNDAWSGQLSEPNAARTNGPFATINRARQAVAALKQRPGGLTRPVNVLVRGGVYYLSPPLYFSSSDSGTESCPVSYEAYPGETPVISGGRPMGGWTLHSDSIYRCSVVGMSVTGRPIRQLSHKRQKQHLARYPNYDPQDPLRGGYMFTRQPESNSKVIQWVCRPPDWVEYDVSLPATGTYYLWTYCAGHPGTAGLNVSIEGGQTLAAVVIPTQDYLTFSWSARSSGMSLSAGLRKIRFTSIYGHNGFYPDAWVFCNDPGYDPVTNAAAPGSHIVRVEAESFARKQSQPISMDDGRDTIEIGYNPAPDLPEYRTSATLPMVRESWGSAPEAEMVVFQPDQMDWLTNVVPVSGVDAEAGKVMFGQSTLCSFTAGRRCYIRNVFGELDVPGEWYLDKSTATLYFWPPDGKKPANGDVVLGYLDRVVNLQGTASARISHIAFRGLTFRDTTAHELGGVEFPSDGGIRLIHAENCIFEDCRMIDLAANAITLDPSCRNITIRGCEISGAGSCGILQPPSPNYQSALLTGHHIVGNDIHHIAQIHKGTGAIELYYGGNTVEYNYLHDLPRWGVVFPFNKGGQNTVRYNEIRRTCLETADCGPIHTSPHFGDGGEIAHNLIVDAPGLATDSWGNYRSPYGTWAIYLDCYAGGYDVHDNVVAGTTSGGYVTAGPNNIFTNNMIINGSIYGTLPTLVRGITTGNRVERNVFYFTEANAHLHRPAGDLSLLNTGIVFDHNLVYHNGLPVKVAGVGSWSAWQAMGCDVHSVIADPLFENLKTEDFRLKANSPALALGIRSVDLSNVGLRGYPARTFYVSPDGDDTSDGRSPVTAWATIDRGDRDGMLLPGDTVLVAAGTYVLANPLSVCAGTFEKPITYKAQGEVIIEAPGVSGHALKLQWPSRYIVLDGFRLSGGQSALRLDGTLGSEVRHCRLSDRAAGTAAPLLSMAGCGSSTIHHNIIGPGTAPWTSGIEDNGSLGANRFYNNTIADLTGWGFSVSGDASVPGMEFRNNIIAKASGGIATQGPALAHSHNILYRITQAPYAGTSPGPQERTTSPRFFDAATCDYRLRTGSPAIDAGIDVGFAYTGAAPDLGALEYAPPFAVDAVGLIRAMPDGSFVRLTNAVVTAASGVFADDVIYVTDQFRLAGICVFSSPSMPPVAEGQRVSVEGTLATIDGERVIRATALAAV